MTGNTSYTVDETKDYPKLTNTDFILAQDCVIYRTVSVKTGKTVGRDQICGKSNLKELQEMDDALQDTECKVIKNVPKGAPCKIKTISRFVTRSGHIWLSFYTISISVAGDEVDASALWEPRDFIHQVKTSGDLNWEDYLLTTSASNEANQSKEQAE